MSDTSYEDEDGVFRRSQAVSSSSEFGDADTDDLCEILMIEREEAAALLTRFHGDVNAAVNFYLTEGRSWTMDSSEPYDDDDDAVVDTDVTNPAASVVTVSGGGNWFLSLLNYIVASPLRLISAIFQFVTSSIVSFFGGDADVGFISGGVVASRQRALEQHRSVLFQREFQAKCPDLRNVCLCGFDDAKRESFRQLKCLLIYVHDGSNASSARFLEEVLPGDAELTSTLNDRFLVWPCLSGSSDVSGIIGSLFRGAGGPLTRMTRSPFLGVYVPKESTVGVILSNLSAYLAAPAVLKRRLDEMRESIDDMLSDERAKRRKLEEDRALRREQDERFRESLKIDRMKEMEREKAKVAEMEAKVVEQSRLQAIADARKRAKQFLTTQEPDASDPDHIMLNFACPNGKRLRRRFLTSKHRCSDIFRFLYAHDDCVPDTITLASPAFSELGSILSMESDDRTLKDAGINRSGTFYVDRNS